MLTGGGELIRLIIQYPFSCLESSQTRGITNKIGYSRSKDLRTFKKTSKMIMRWKP